MNTSELRSKRIAQNKDVPYMASVIGKSNDAYAKKERGVVKFTPDEMAAVTNDLCLSPAEFNNIFFDSRLLFGKSLSKHLSEL